MLKIQDQKTALMQQAQPMFLRGYLRGKVGLVWSRLTGRSGHLLDLSAFEATGIITSRHYGGTQSVPVDQIQGSEGRCLDFDRNFNPLQMHAEQRWLNIAMAWLAGTALPPVELIQVGDIYFVQDGHHRISVSRALGITYIDAKVTVWNVDKSTSAENPAVGRQSVLQPV